MIFATRRRSPLKAVARFVGAVFMTSGVLLLADAAVTLLWQEPVSAFLASREQRALESQLERQVERASTRTPRYQIPRRPLRGDAIGEIEMPTLDRSYYMVEGTDAESLRKGPGHYPDTPLPGRRGTVAVAGHRTTYGAPFRTIDQLDRGDRIVMSMPWGRYVYRVERSRIVEPTALWVTRRVGYDRLVLTACHPLYSAAQRIVVFARFARRQPPTLQPG
jgi:sortase A